MAEEKKEMQTTKTLVGAALVLAATGLLHLLSPSFLGITVNWAPIAYMIIVKMFDINLRMALVVGFVNGILNMVTSKGIFPLGNLPGELVGMLSCYYLYRLLKNLDFDNYVANGIICTIATCFSGIVFIILVGLAFNYSMQTILFKMFPVVLSVAIVDGILFVALSVPLFRYAR